MAGKRASRSAAQVGREVRRILAAGDVQRRELAPLSRETWDDGTVISWMASPFPFERKPAVPTSMHRDTRVATVDLDQLIGTQRRVTQRGVKMHASTDPDGDLPLVYQSSRGRLYIADGHHRLAAQYLRGRTRARVNIVDIGDLDR